MLSLVMCHEVKSVSCSQNSWIVSTIKSSASSGRFLSMSMVMCDIPGALLLFILVIVFLISFFGGTVGKECCIGCCWISSASCSS
jgi:hypothetical protein